MFNDYSDYDLDCRERPERPLPSGTVSRRTALGLAVVLMIVGLALAVVVDATAFGIAVFIAAMIFLYNAWAK